jgi:hypothetical protein
MPQTGNPTGDIAGHTPGKKWGGTRAGVRQSASVVWQGAYKGACRSASSRPRATAWVRLCTSSLP